MRAIRAIPLVIAAARAVRAKSADATGGMAAAVAGVGADDSAVRIDAAIQWSVAGAAVGSRRILCWARFTTSAVVPHVRAGALAVGIKT